jgi:hypothetical protein
LCKDAKRQNTSLSEVNTTLECFVTQERARLPEVGSYFARLFGGSSAIGLDLLLTSLPHCRHR